MNKIKRLLFGALSTLLLAVGFSRAATHFDPISNDLAGGPQQELRGSPDSSQYCDEVSH